jgi:hypothetical protein
MGAEPVTAKHYSIIRWALIHHQVSYTSKSWASQRLLRFIGDMECSNYRLLLRCVAEKPRDEAGATQPYKTYWGYERSYF